MPNNVKFVHRAVEHVSTGIYVQKRTLHISSVVGTCKFFSEIPGCSACACSAGEGSCHTFRFLPITRAAA